MKLYEAYIAERRGMHLLVDSKERGFASYRYQQPYCHIVDIYVIPGARRLGVGSAMADLITEYARENNCTHLLGTVDSQTNGWVESLKAQLDYGFTPLRITQDGVIVLEKRIEVI